MTDRDAPEGTVAANRWPSTLPAHVASPGDTPRVQGFALVDDLAAHYDFAEFLITALTGTPPSKAWGRAANVALVVLAGTSVADAAVHVATLARRCGADDSAALSAGLLTLAQQASQAPPPTPPDDSAEALFRTLPQEVRDALGHPGTDARALARRILSGAGLTSPMHLATALCIAQLPVLAAEVDAVGRGDVQGYPMQLPRYRYESPDESP